MDRIDLEQGMGGKQAVRPGLVAKPGGARVKTRAQIAMMVPPRGGGCRPMPQIAQRAHQRIDFAGLAVIRDDRLQCGHRCSGRERRFCTIILYKCQGGSWTACRGRY
jgi:hypothetical protein